MDTEILTIVVLGIVSVIALVVMGYMNATRKGELTALLEGLAATTDRLLAQYGDTPGMRLAHDLSQYAQAAVDDADDPLIAYLAKVTGVRPDKLSTALSRLVVYAERWTDGEPQPEHIPANTPGEAVH